MEKHFHTITRGDRKYNIEVAELDFFTFLLTVDVDEQTKPVGERVVRVGGTLSKIVEEFVAWQNNTDDIFNDPVVSFDFEGQCITDPWVDPSARFPHTTVDAIRMYGVQNVAKFITDVITFLFDIKEEA